MHGDRFETIRKIGAGTFGEVFECVDRRASAAASSSNKEQGFLSSPETSPFVGPTSSPSFTRMTGLPLLRPITLPSSSAINWAITPLTDTRKNTSDQHGHLDQQQQQQQNREPVSVAIKTSQDTQIYRQAMLREAIILRQLKGWSTTTTTATTTTPKSTATTTTTTTPTIPTSSSNCSPTEESTSSHIVPQLVTTFDREDRIHLVMELMKGGNLYEYLKSVRRFTSVPVADIRKCLFRLLHTLKKLHSSLGYIHCDVKLENIMFRSKNHDFDSTCLIDFGSARLEAENRYFDVQSLWYRAPEVMCNIPYNRSIDVWSLGCVGFELLCAAPLVPALTITDALTRVTEMCGLLPFRWKRSDRATLNAGGGETRRRRKRRRRTKGRTVVGIDDGEIREANNDHDDGDDDVNNTDEEQREQDENKNEQNVDDDEEDEQGDDDDDDDGSTAGSLSDTFFESENQQAPKMQKSTDSSTSSSSKLAFMLNNIRGCPASLQSLLLAMLQVDPEKRISVDAALDHEFFDPIRNVVLTCNNTSNNNNNNNNVNCGSALSSPQVATSYSAAASPPVASSPSPSRWTTMLLPGGRLLVPQLTGTKSKVGNTSAVQADEQQLGKGDESGENELVSLPDDLLLASGCTYGKDILGSKLDDGEEAVDGNRGVDEEGDAQNEGVKGSNPGGENKVMAQRAPTNDDKIRLQVQNQHQQQGTRQHEQRYIDPREIAPPSRFAENQQIQKQTITSNKDRPTTAASNRFQQQQESDSNDDDDDDDDDRRTGESLLQRLYRLEKERDLEERIQQGIEENLQGPSIPPSLSTHVSLPSSVRREHTYEGDQRYQHRRVAAADEEDEQEEDIRDGNEAASSPSSLSIVNSSSSSSISFTSHASPQIHEHSLQNQQQNQQHQQQFHFFLSSPPLLPSSFASSSPSSTYQHQHHHHNYHQGRQQLSGGISPSRNAVGGIYTLQSIIRQNRNEKTNDNDNNKFASFSSTDSSTNSSPLLLHQQHPPPPPQQHLFLSATAATASHNQEQKHQKRSVLVSNASMHSDFHLLSPYGSIVGREISEDEKQQRFADRCDQEQPLQRQTETSLKNVNKLGSSCRDFIVLAPPVSIVHQGVPHQGREGREGQDDDDDEDEDNNNNYKRPRRNDGDNCSDDDDESSALLRQPEFLLPPIVDVDDDDDDGDAPPPPPPLPVEDDDDDVDNGDDKQQVQYHLHHNIKKDRNNKDAVHKEETDSLLAAFDAALGVYAKRNNLSALASTTTTIIAPRSISGPFHNGAQRGSHYRNNVNLLPALVNENSRNNKNSEVPVLRRYVSPPPVEDEIIDDL